VEGEPENMKITTAADLVLAEALLLQAPLPAPGMQ
jgi:2-C-methyl-D-erythritol 4-phosphate cytidylyltransferase